MGATPGSGRSIVVASIPRVVLLATDTEPGSSFPWLATIQCIESEEYLAGLTPQGCFISAEAIEREVGQIGEAQKALREVGARIDRMFDKFLPRALDRFVQFVRASDLELRRNWPSQAGRTSRRQFLERPSEFGAPA